MSNVYQAFIVSLAPMLTGFVSANIGCQTFTRPIFLGMVTGLLCGNIRVGCTMGALMESVYMGVSAIGGVSAADTTTSTTVGTGLMIFQGVDIATAVTVASVIGQVTNSFTAVPKALRSAYHPFVIKQTAKGNWNGMRIMMVLGQVCIQLGWTFLMTFICMTLGQTVLQRVLEVLPKFILKGLNTAGNMMVVIGFALTAQAIWMKNAFWYVLLGFCLTKYLNMTTLPVAFVGVILAVLTFTRDVEIKELKEAGVAGNGGDDFYG